MADPKPIERWRIVSDHLKLMDRPAPSLAGDWVLYEDHRADREGLLARVEELEAQARELNRGMAMLCSAMQRRSYEEIRTTFGGNTPELWCATADELCGLLAHVEDLEEALRDKRRLARMIDVAMHGEDQAAAQPSLCDLVSPARWLRERAEAAEGRVEELERERAELRSRIDGVTWEHEEAERGEEEAINERDRANDALQRAHIALGGDGEWCAKPGQTCAAGKTGELAIDVPALAEQVKTERDEARARVEELERERDRYKAEADEYQRLQEQLPPDWDGDEAPATIILNHVRWLTGERDEAREAAEDLRAHLKGSGSRERALMEERGRLRARLRGTSEALDGPLLDRLQQERDEARKQLGVAREALTQIARNTTDRGAEIHVEETLAKLQEREREQSEQEPRNAEQRIQKLAANVSEHRQKCERGQAGVNTENCWEIKTCKDKQ